MENFVLTMVYGCYGVAALVMAGYWGIYAKQVFPFMLFAVTGLFMLFMGYKISPYKDKEEK